MRVTGQEEATADWGFEVPAAGTYDWQLEEGIKLNTNEDTGSKTYEFPLTLVRVIKGEAEVGDTSKMYVCVRGKSGQVLDFAVKRIGNILAAAKIAEKFAKKYSTDFEPDDPKFAADLKLKLTGSVIRMTHIIEKAKNKDGNEIDSVNWKGITEPKGKVDKPKPKDKDIVVEEEENEPW